jgi:hypothetical protein
MFFPSRVRCAVKKGQGDRFLFSRIFSHIFLGVIQRSG